MQTDPSLRCLLIESMNTVVYVDKQRKARSDCTDAHADVNLCCSHMTQEPLFHVVHQIQNFYNKPTQTVYMKGYIAFTYVLKAIHYILVYTS